MSPSIPESPDALLPLKTEVLWLLMSLNGREGHGYGLMQDVEARSRGQVRIQTGALYRILHRMEDDGVVAIADSPADETDTRRRYYRITDFGRAVLAAELSRMKSVLEAGMGDGVSPSQA